MARTHPSKPNSIQLWNIYIIHIRLKVYKEMEKNVNPLFEVELNETGWDIVDGRRIPQHKLKVYPQEILITSSEKQRSFLCILDGMKMMKLNVSNHKN